MRGLMGTLFALVLVFCGGMTVHASVTYSQEIPPADAETVDWSDHASEADAAKDSADSDVETTASSAAPALESAILPDAPDAAELVVEDGATLLKMTYELSPGEEWVAAVQTFEQDGMLFTLRDTLREELLGEVLTMPVSVTAMTSTGSDDEGVIRAQFPASIDHEENGYSGRLALVTSSLTTQADDWDSYSYTSTETEQVTGLARNDPALLDLERPGMTLVDVTFDGVGGTRTGDSLLPDSYTANITWTSTASGRTPIRYRTTAAYTGQISMTIPGNVLYTAVYEGTPMENEQLTVDSDGTAEGGDLDDDASLFPVEDSPGEDAEAGADAVESTSDEVDVLEEVLPDKEPVAFPYLPLLIGQTVLIVVLIAILIVRHRKMGGIHIEVC